MFKHLIVLLFLLGLLFGVKAQSPISIPFYTENIVFDLKQVQLPGQPTKISLTTARQYLRKLKSLDMDKLARKLDQLQKQYVLNDWLLYQLLEKVIKKLYNPTKFQQKIINYCYLRQLGFDVRLAYWNSTIFVYAASENQIYKTPFIKIGTQRYYNLTAIQDFTIEKVENIMLIDKSSTNIRHFSFELDQLPNFRPDTVHHQLAFEYQNDSIKIDFQSDANIKTIISNHPMIDENAYFEVPLSTTLKTSLLPSLKNAIQHKSFPEAIKLFTYITRSCFLYAEDEGYFGYSKPMAGEEVFLYEKSDCEDRSALLYQLVKVLLDLPMAVIIYPEHVTLGIAIPDFKGEHIMWNDTPYYICDPTGPVNSTVIGRFPKGYKEKPYEILLTYK